MILIDDKLVMFCGVGLQVRMYFVVGEMLRLDSYFVFSKNQLLTI